MSLKLYLIIISNAANVNLTELPAKLDLHVQPRQSMTLAEAQYTNALSIGRFEDKIVLVSGELVFDFYEKTPTNREKQIAALFSNSDITVLTLNSTVDLYGFSLIRNGQRVWVKSGNEEEKFIDFGEPLPEEIKLIEEPPFSPDEMKAIETDYPEKDARDRFLDKEYMIRVVEILCSECLGQNNIEYSNLLDQITVTTYGE